MRSLGGDRAAGPKGVQEGGERQTGADLVGVASGHALPQVACGAR
jgi:hypothetical protein